MFGQKCWLWISACRKSLFDKLIFLLHFISIMFIINIIPFIHEGGNKKMRKPKKKIEKQAVQSEQTKDALVSAAAEGEQAAEAPVALAQEAPVVTDPAPKRRGRKAKAEKPEAEEAAPKRIHKTKVGKMAAELSSMKKKQKEKAEIPANAEETVFLQYGGQEVNVAELRERIIAAYVEAGHRRGRISKLNIYMKPEDQKVYYVINDKTSGSINF
jgi:hypothetical protein